MKHLSNNKRAQRGFTLVELTIVMALLALVGIIAVSITLMATRAERNFRLDAETSSELLDAEAHFKDWLMQYDAQDKTLTVTSSSLTVQSGGATESFSFQEGVLTCTANSAEEKTEFNAIMEMKFSCAGKVICCEVTVSDLGSCKFLYTMRAATVMDGAA